MELCISLSNLILHLPTPYIILSKLLNGYQNILPCQVKQAECHISYGQHASDITTTHHHISLALLLVTAPFHFYQPTRHNTLLYSMHTQRTTYSLTINLLWSNHNNENVAIPTLHRSRAPPLQRSASLTLIHSSVLIKTYRIIMNTSTNRNWYYWQQFISL